MCGPNVFIHFEKADSTSSGTSYILNGELITNKILIYCLFSNKKQESNFLFYLPKTVIKHCTDLKDFDFEFWNPNVTAEDDSTGKLSRTVFFSQGFTKHQLLENWIKSESHVTAINRNFRKTRIMARPARLNMSNLRYIFTQIIKAEFIIKLNSYF